MPSRGLFSPFASGGYTFGPLLPPSGKVFAEECKSGNSPAT
jgi:hypothetical protein